MLIPLFKKGLVNCWPNPLARGPSPRSRAKNWLRVGGGAGGGGLARPVSAAHKASLTLSTDKLKGRQENSGSFDGHMGSKDKRSRLRRTSPDSNIV